MDGGDRIVRSSPAVALLTAGLAAAAMLLAFRWAPQTYDWRGYEILYLRDGGWLAAGGRDLGFVWILKLANRLLGPDGYPAFRAVLSVLFVAFLAWLAFRTPRQRLGALQAPAVALLIVAVFMLKMSIQVREGVAFGLVVVGLEAVFYNRSLVRAGLAMLVAVTIHSGIGVFMVALVAAAALARATRRTGAAQGLSGGSSPQMRWLMVVGAALFGLGVVWLLTRLGDLTFVLVDMGVYVSAADPSGAKLRLLYWGGNAVVIFLLCRQLGAAAQAVPLRPTAIAYIEIVAWLLLPALTVICLSMVGLDLLPNAISFFARLLFTTMGLGLIILALLGRMTLITAAVSVWVLADSLRLYVGSLLPF